jgi:hypothetical protein
LDDWGYLQLSPNFTIMFMEDLVLLLHVFLL